MSAGKAAIASLFLAAAFAAPAQAKMTEAARELTETHDISIQAGTGDQQSVWFALQYGALDARARRDAFVTTAVGLSPTLAPRPQSREDVEQMLTLILRHSPENERQAMLDAALEQLAGGSKVSMVRFLLEQGANPNCDSPQLLEHYNLKVQRALSQAALNPTGNASTMVFLLMKYGADPALALEKFDDGFEKHRAAKALVLQKAEFFKKHPAAPSQKP